MQYSNFLIKTELKLKVLNYLSIILLILGRLNDAASAMIIIFNFKLKKDH